MDPDTPLFRTMTPASDGGPVVASSARGLGARVPDDISPDEAGMVGPDRGGLSVSPGSVWNLPAHRRPRTMGRGSTGHAVDAVYETAPRALSSWSLTVRADPAAPTTHAFVEPAARCLLSEYQQNIARSRIAWRRVET